MRRRVLIFASVAVLASLGAAMAFVSRGAVTGRQSAPAGAVTSAASVNATGGGTTTADTAADNAVPPAPRKIRVLIVPGHEPNDGGARFGTLLERDLNVQLAGYLKGFLDADGRYETILTRDAGGWNPIIAAYFSSQWDQIDAWRLQARKDMNTAVAAGTMAAPVVSVSHNAAEYDAAVRLYGITKWANENAIDVEIHVHFDDDRVHSWSVGKHAGFAIFVPPAQFGNGGTTRAIADKVLHRLSSVSRTADVAGESAGIVEDPQLIAVGAEDTARSPSMLIEYGFVYDKRLRQTASRVTMLRDFARQTSNGLGDFFFPDGRR